MQHTSPSTRSVQGAALVCVLAGLCWIPNAAAQEDEKRAFRVGGLLFGDLYHVVSHHTDEGDGATGAVLRHGYLTFDAGWVRTHRWSVGSISLNASGSKRPIASGGSREHKQWWASMAGDGVVLSSAFSIRQRSKNKTGCRRFASRKGEIP